MKIFIERENRTVQKNIAQIKADDLLNELGINPVTVIVTKNGTVITEDAMLEKGDDVKIISVVSGG